jgi:nucleolar GTP-binding protein
MDVDVDGDDDDDDGAALEQDGGEGADAVMDVDDGEWEDEDDTPRKRGKANSGAAFARKRAPQSNRQLAGMRDEAQASKAIRMRNVSQRQRNMLAKAGESDRAIRVKMPKHLFSGKRKSGKTNRR